MVSSFSTNLKLELTGEKSGTWGTTIQHQSTAIRASSIRLYICRLRLVMLFGMNGAVSNGKIYTTN